MWPKTLAGVVSSLFPHWNPHCILTVSSLYLTALLQEIAWTLSARRRGASLPSPTQRGSAAVTQPATPASPATSRSSSRTACAPGAVASRSMRRSILTWRGLSSVLRTPGCPIFASRRDSQVPRWKRCSAASRRQSPRNFLQECSEDTVRMQ